MGSDVLKKFGRYFLLDMIAQGGMAEIYRAKQRSISGPGREVVIKRIQAGYSNNSDFRNMFSDEIRVTQQFNHPNIVQIYDTGKEDDQLYIAMELVDGRNLRQFISRFSELGRDFPIELSVYIIEQVALGLQYAHSYKDKQTGKPLNVVHRDISPQNILISYEGNVKVIDFGIAKANSNVESTRAGVIKGKPSYLSPEQISGAPLDGRSDIFSLGAVLWETLTMRKLFTGENEIAIIRQIESCATTVKPPSTLNQKVPKELDAIVMKALAKSVDRRFQSAEEMQRALHKFLYNYLPEFNPSDLAYFAKDLFQKEIVEDRKKLQSLNTEAERLLSSPQGSNYSGRGGTMVESFARHKDGVQEVVITPETTSTEGRSERETVISLVRGDSEEKVEMQPGGQQVPQQAYVDPTRVDSSATQVQPSPTRVAPIAPQRAAMPFPGTAASVPTRNGSIRTATPSASQSSHLAVRKRSYGPWIAVAAGLGLLVYYGPQYGLSIPSFTGAVRDPASVPSASTAPTNPGESQADSSKRFITLRLNIQPIGGKPRIILDGKSIDPERPTAQVEVDKQLDLQVERAGYNVVHREFWVPSQDVPKDANEWVMDVMLEPIRAGFLSIRTTPSADAEIMIEGQPLVKKTPFQDLKLPEGTYNIRLVNTALQIEKRVTVTIREGKVLSLDEHLVGN